MLKESIFDHNPTEDEIEAIYPPDVVPGITMDEILTMDQAWLLEDIYRLYVMRGDKLQSEKYFNKLPELVQMSYV